MTGDLSLAPFHFLVQEDGTHELLLFDGDMAQVEDVFDANNAEANGYGWESLASWLTHVKMPDLAEAISFSSEGGTFVAASSDPAALRRLAERLHGAFHDHSLLAQLIVEAEID
ncbi:MAG: Imm51 family immunity protein [Actinomycetota bacterium]|nr:Imm51 family immunity protein [Actinomycetota bacterium]